MRSAGSQRISLISLLLLAACASAPTWDDIVGEQAARPTPSPPPTDQTSCAAGPFVMHFETNRDELAAASKAVLDHMVQHYHQRECRPGSFVVTGHADRSGPHDLNVALSQRRLNAVRDYLLSKGVPEAFLVSQAMGEDCPRIATADGISEATNRRVEVRLLVFSTAGSIAHALECENPAGHGR